MADEHERFNPGYELQEERDFIESKSGWLGEEGARTVYREYVNPSGLPPLSEVGKFASYPMEGFKQILEEMDEMERREAFERDSWLLRAQKQTSSPGEQPATHRSSIAARIAFVRGLLRKIR